MITLNGGKIWKRGTLSTNDEFAIQSDSVNQAFPLKENDWIVPGVFDAHIHLWSPASYSAFGIGGTRVMAAGTTAAIEPGSFGRNNWETADKYWQASAGLRVKSFVHVLPEGLAVFPPVTPTLPENLEIEKTIDFIEEHKCNGTLLGVKVHLGWLPYKSEETDRALLKAAWKVARATKTRLMVHISGEIISVDEMADMLEEGDIISHIYTGFGNGVLDANKKMHRSILAAHRRGVIFDTGLSGKHFSSEVFKEAYKQGCGFDLMGSDLTAASWTNRAHYNRYHIYEYMQEFLEAGVPETEVLKGLVDKPAEIMGIQPSFEKSCVVVRTKTEDEKERYCEPILVTHNGKVWVNKL